MVGLEDILIRLRGQDNTGSAFSSAQQRAGALKTAVGGAATMMSAAMLGYAKSAVDSAVEAEQGWMKFGNAVKNTGGNWEQQSDSIKKWVKDYSNAMGRSVADTRAAMTTYMNMGLSLEDSQKAMDATSNYAAQMGMSQEEAAGQLQKAFMGNGRALKSLGLDIKDYKDSTTGAIDRQKLLNDVLQRTGGAANNYANSAAGKFQRLNNVLASLKTDFGSALLDAITPLLPVVQGFLNLINGLPGPVKTVGFAAIALGAGIGVIAGPLTSVIGLMEMLGISLPTIGGLMGMLGAETAALSAEELALAAAEAGLTMEEIAAAAAHASNGVAVAAEGTAAAGASVGFWAMAAAELAALWPVLLIIAAVAAFIVVVEQIGEALGWWTDFGTMLDAIRAGVMRLWEAFINSPQVQGVLQGIQWAFEQLWNAVKPIFDWLGAAWNNLFKSDGAGSGGPDVVGAIINAFATLGSVASTVFSIIQAGFQIWLSFVQPVFTAVAGLVGVFAQLITGQISLQEAFSRASTIISEMFAGLRNALLSLASQIIPIIISVLSQLPGLIGGALGQIGGAVWGAVSQIPGIIWNALSQIPSMFGEAFSQAVPFAVLGMFGIGPLIIGYIAGILPDIGSTLVNGFTDIVGNVKDTLLGINPSLQILFDLFDTTWTNILSLIGGVVGPIKDTITGLMDIFGQLGSGQISLTTAVANAWNLIGGNITNILMNIGTVFTDFALSLLEIGIQAAENFVSTFFPQFSGLPSRIGGYLRAGLIAISTGILDWVYAASTGATQFGSTVINGLSNMGSQISSAVTNAFNGVAGIITSFTGTIGSAARNLGRAIYNGVVNGVKNVGGGVSSALSGVGARVSAAGGGIVSRARSIGTGIGNGIYNGVRTAPARITQILRAIVVRLQAIRASVFARAKSIATGLRNGILSNIGSIPGRIGSIIGSIPGRIASAAGAVAAAAASLASQAVNSVVSGFSGLANTVYQEFVNIGNKINEAVSGAVSAATSFGNDIKNAVLSALHIASPGIIQKKIAIEFADIPGRIRESITSVTRSAKDYAKGIIDGFGNPSVAGNLNLNPNIKGQLQSLDALKNNPYLSNNALNLGSISGLASSNPYTPNMNKGGSVTIVVSEGAVQLDARNLTTSESKKVMINALEGLDMIRNIDIKGDYGY